MTTTCSGFVTGDEVPEPYTNLVQPHVDSFNYFVGEGMDLAIAGMEPLEVMMTKIMAHDFRMSHTHSFLACALIMRPDACADHASHHQVHNQLLV